MSVVGTPAEEVGDAGGKILLLERGAFAGVHAAMMVHPSPYEASARGPRPSGKPRCRQPGATTFPRASVIPWKPPSTQRTFG